MWAQHGRNRSRPPQLPRQASKGKRQGRAETFKCREGRRSLFLSLGATRVNWGKEGRGQERGVGGDGGRGSPAQQQHRKEEDSSHPLRDEEGRGGQSAREKTAREERWSAASQRERDLSAKNKKNKLRGGRGVLQMEMRGKRKKKRGEGGSHHHTDTRGRWRSRCRS